MRVALSLFVCCLAAQAQPGNAHLEGRVVDAAGAPVRKASLTLRSTTQPTPHVYEVESDAQGKYTFDGILPESYFLSAERVGFLEKTWRPTPHETMSPIMLAAGQKLTGVDMVLIRASTISGRVLDGDGDPVTGVRVTLLQPRYQNGRRVFQPGRNVTTDESGAYRLPDLSAGDYWLSAGEGRDAAFGIRGMRLMGEFHGGDATPDYYANTEPMPVRLETGAERAGTDFHLKKIAAFEVRGKIDGMTPGHSLEQCRVSLLGAGHTMVRPGPVGDGTGGRINPDGTFEFPGLRFPAGEYTLMVTQYPRLALLRQPLAIAKDEDNVTIRLGPLIEVRGTIVIEGKGTLSPMTQIVLFAKGGSLFSDAHAKVAADGSFVVTDVAPGSYSVQVPGIGGEFYLKSGGDVDVRGGMPAVKITVSSAMAQISGTAPAGDAITLVGEPAGVSDISTLGAADRNGQFTLARVPPGTYRLYCWEDLETAQHYDPDFLERYKSQSTVVTVAENGTARVSLKAIPAR